jgi:hypothetical protein
MISMKRQQSMEAAIQERTAMALPRWGAPLLYVMVRPILAQLQNANFSKNGFIDFDYI